METGGLGLDGARVLVVEDETMVAMFIEDALERMGCLVAGSAARLSRALEMARSLPLDAALLDVNLGNGERSFPVADALSERGVPFIFVTGYGAAGVESAYAGRQVLAKPVDEAKLEGALRELLGGP